MNARLVNRFWSKVVVSGPSQCWEWAASKKHGYGQLSAGARGSRMLIASRVAYAIHHGLEMHEIPVGMMVCHTCDNRGCCNPAHLFLGTAVDNVRDMVAKGRQRTILGQSANVGSANAKAKLTEEDVRNIRSGNFSSARQVSMLFHIGQRAALNVLQGRSWRHVS